MTLFWALIILLLLLTIASREYEIHKLRQIVSQFDERARTPR